MVSGAAAPGDGAGRARVSPPFGSYTGCSSFVTDQITLTQDAERAFREAENLCWRTNTGIVAPEHLLAGCLRVLNTAGFPGLPADERVEQALLMAQGMSEDALTQNVMFGSAAREAVNFTARLVREAGGGEIDPSRLPTASSSRVRWGRCSSRRWAPRRRNSWPPWWPQTSKPNRCRALP